MDYSPPSAGTFTLVLDGEAQDVAVTTASLGEDLRAAGIVLSIGDELDADANAPAVPGSEVHLDRLTSEIVTETITHTPERIQRDNPDLPHGTTRVVQEANESTETVTTRVWSLGGHEVRREELLRSASAEPLPEIVEVGTRDPQPEPAPTKTATTSEGATGPAEVSEPGTSARYSLSRFLRDGVVEWGGKKFTYYSQRVLPGGGLNIPGRHVSEEGYVCDGDGYIVLANDAPKGTVIDTPFGRQGKVYDRGTYGRHFDVYVR